MEVILLEKDINLGNLGDVVHVCNGYARNYLIPYRKARRATPKALREFAMRSSELKKAQTEKLHAAQILSQSLNGYELRIEQRSSVDGRLFGSVTNIDIAKGLVKAGFGNFRKGQIQMPGGPFKKLGNFLVQVMLHTDVTVNIKVCIESESP